VTRDGRPQGRSVPVEDMAGVLRAVPADRAGWVRVLERLLDAEVGGPPVYGGVFCRPCDELGGFTAMSDAAQWGAVRVHVEVTMAAAGMDLRIVTGLVTGHDQGWSSCARCQQRVDLRDCPAARRWLAQDLAPWFVGKSTAAVPAGDALGGTACGPAGTDRVGAAAGPPGPVGGQVGAGETAPPPEGGTRVARWLCVVLGALGALCGYAAGAAWLAVAGVLLLLVGTVALVAGRGTGASGEGDA